MGSSPSHYEHERLYAALDRAALDPGAWAEVCDGLSGVVGAAGAMFVPLRVEARTEACPYSVALEEPIHAYLSDWTDRDYRGDRGFPAILSRGVAADQDFSTPEQMRHCPFYNELLAPFGFKWCLAMSFKVNNDIWAAVLQGRISDPPFQDDQKHHLLAVRQHLTVAARRAASSGFDRAEDWKAALEGGGRAVLGLDGTGRVLAVSPAAEPLLGDGLNLRGGRLFTSDPGLNARLALLIEAAIHYEAGSSRPLPPPLAIRTATGRSLHIDALPLPRDYQSLLTRIVALLLLRETDDRAAVQELLRRRFGLTPAEIRLALALADGIDVQQAAERSGIRTSTARAQLRSIFAKTETHRQGELIAMIAKLI